MYKEFIMEGLIFLFIVVGIGGIILVLIAISENNQIDCIPEDCVARKHDYTEEEYITLFNFCIDKLNIQYSKIPNSSAYNVEYLKWRKMNELLERVKSKYHDPYNKPDYSKLCLELLSLLPEWEREKINYGILNH
jgi:hypothetical protein